MRNPKHDTDGVIMPPQLSHLVHVLDTQNTGLGRDDVAWGFDSAESRKRLSDWVDEYLSPHTLLTAEEAALYVLFAL